VDFIPPATDEDDLGDEETMPLDGGAASSDGEGREDKAYGDSNDDEDPDIWCIGSLIASWLPFLFSAYWPSLVRILVFYLMKCPPFAMKFLTLSFTTSSLFVSLAPVQFPLFMLSRTVAPTRNGK